MRTRDHLLGSTARRSCVPPRETLVAMAQAALDASADTACGATLVLPNGEVLYLQRRRPAEGKRDA